MTPPIPQATGLYSLDVGTAVWERFFMATSLFVIGTREEDGDFDLAPKHMAVPLGWDNYFGFVCTPRHRTYHNAVREEAFTVSLVHPDQVVEASFSAGPRAADESKPSLAGLATFPATVVDGVLLAHSHVFLECLLDRVVDGFGDNSLIAGRIVAAYVREEALRIVDLDDQDVVAGSPLLAYLAPGRYTVIERSAAFPYHAGFER